MAFSRRNACIVYGLMLILTIGCVTVFGFVANVAFCALVILYFVIAIIYYLLYIPYCKQQSKVSIAKTLDNDKRSQLSVQINQPTENEIASTNDKNNNSKPTKKPPKKPPRLYYLDNLKSFLTTIVVIHHITGSFSGQGWIYTIGNYYNPFLIFAVTLQIMNQSYFMCLFFFISGYFTPTSCDRKGVNKFMADKFKRLGIPFLIYTFIIGPALDILINKVFLNNSHSYFPDEGPCWFLAWLLIFNTCYVTIDQNVSPYLMQFPSLIRLIIYGIVLGVIQVVIYPLLGGQYIFMPISTGSLPFNIVFFTAGVIAKRNHWLSLTSPVLTSNVIILRVMTVICFLIWVGLFTWMYIINIGHGVIPNKHESETSCDSTDVTYDTAILVGIIGMFVFAGIFCMIVSLTILQFAAMYWNFTNKLSKFLSQSAYCVYLIHPWIIVPIFWTWIQLLEKFGGPKMEFCHNKSVSKTHLGHNYLVLVGWIYCVVVSLIIVWPLAWCIRKIPGLNKII